MLNFKKLVAIAAMTMMSSGAFASKLPESDRAALHTAMLQHIERQATSGIYLHVNLKDGHIQQYSPAKAHPMMFTFGENYVLCTDFKDKDGKSAMVDFYVTKRGKTFAVFQTEINNREPLMKLMEAGKVKSAD